MSDYHRVLDERDSALKERDDALKERDEAREIACEAVDWLDQCAVVQEREVFEASEAFFRRTRTLEWLAEGVRKRRKMSREDR
jgi:hypothetical protein